MNLIETGHHEINADGDPDLRLHCVFGCTVECLDAEVLLYPFKEKFDVPAILVDVCDGDCGQTKMVGDEHEAFACFTVDETDATEFFGIVPFTFGSFQSDTLIASQSSSFVGIAGLADIESHITFGSGYEESTDLMDAIKSSKIYVSTIHHVDTSRLESNVVKDVHIVDAALCNADEHRNRASQINHGMQLDRSFGLAKMSPRKHRKTQVDSRGIQSVNHLIEIESVGILGIQAAGFTNKNLPKCFEHAPVPVLISVGKVSSSNVASNAHRIEVTTATKARFDISQALAEGNLSEYHRQKLVAGTHAFTCSGHWITVDASGHLLGIQYIGNLGKNQTSSVHSLLRMSCTGKCQPVQMQDICFFALTIYYEQHTKL